MVCIGIPKAFDQKPGAAPARDQLQLLGKDLPRPNGIAFSPDEKYLYVDNSQPKKMWMRYRVKEDGTLTRCEGLLRCDRGQEAGCAGWDEGRSEGKCIQLGAGRDMDLYAGG